MKESKKEKIVQHLKKIRAEKKLLQTSVPKAVAMIPLLGDYFDEDHTVLIKCFSVSIHVIF